MNMNFSDADKELIQMIFFDVCAMNMGPGFGNIEKVDLLIRLGADVNFKNQRGGTVLLDNAKHGGLSDLTELLIKKGADIDIKYEDDKKSARDYLSFSDARLVGLHDSLREKKLLENSVKCEEENSPGL